MKIRINLSTRLQLIISIHFNPVISIHLNLTISIHHKIIVSINFKIIISIHLKLVILTLTNQPRSYRIITNSFRNHSKFNKIPFIHLNRYIINKISHQISKIPLIRLIRKIAIIINNKSFLTNTKVFNPICTHAHTTTNQYNI